MGSWRFASSCDTPSRYLFNAKTQKQHALFHVERRENRETFLTCEPQAECTSDQSAIVQECPIAAAKASATASLRFGLGASFS